MTCSERTARWALAVAFTTLFTACSGSGESGEDTQEIAENTGDAGALGADDDGADDDGADDDGSDPDGSDPDGSEPVASDDDVGDDTVGDDVLIGVDDDVDPNDGVDVSTDTDGGSPVATGVGGGFVEIGTTDAGTLQALCGTAACACSDGADNDGDELVDGADSECIGPFDNDEGSFATGIPGDNRDPKWQDCFFDGNSGAGDDDCRYHTDCLTGALDSSSPDCTVSDACREYCAPLTPPGCDCFGCCQVESGDGLVNILLGENCSLERIDDEDACPRCEPTDVCGNECGECEVCLGQTLEDLPESCFDSPPDGAGGRDGSGGEGAGGRAGSGGDGMGGSGNAGGENAGGGNTGGSGNPPGDEPPPNLCDGTATSCIDTGDCAAGQYCSLNCCRTYEAR